MNTNGDNNRCSCEDKSLESDNESPSPKESKKSKISLHSIALNLRRGRSLNKRTKKCSSNYSSDNNSENTPPSSVSNNLNGNSSTLSSAAGGSTASNSKKSTKWPLKFYCGKKEQRTVSPVRQETQNQSCCKCTCYKRTEEYQEQQEDNLVAGGGDVVVNDEVETTPEESTNDVALEVEPPSPPPPPVVDEEIIVPEQPMPIVNVIDVNEIRKARNDPPVEGEMIDSSRNRLAHIFVTPNFIDLHWRTLAQEDVDEEARIQRAREIERGVDPPPSFRPARRVQLFCSDETEGHVVRRVQIVCPNDVTVDSLRAIFQNNVTLRTCPLDIITGCHTQVDFIHCLVPDLLNITNCSFYWGKMDRYEAERLLDGKREGTFLLRDSAQEEFLFSVSFRKYGRSLHARIEQWNHKFSFDAHDPGVYTSDTVCGLIEHYKDPTSCMFFEPMLTWPLHRNFVFSLQHLCRASIVNRLTYDDVNQLQLPKSLKTYLKEYHYRQKVRVERFDDDVQWLELRNPPS